MSSPEEPLTPPRGSLKGRVARGGVVIAISTALRSVFDLGATLVVVRLVTPEAFGWVAMVVAVTGLIDMFKEMGLATVTVQRPHITRSQLSALFWLNFAIGAALTLLAAAVAPLLSWVYQQPELTEIGLALSLSMVLGSISIQPMALLRRRMQFERVAIVELSATIASTLAAVVAAFAGLGVWALVVRQLVRPVTAALLAFALAGWQPGLPRRAPVRELLAAGGRLTGFQLTNYVERNLDNALIGKFVGPFDLGCYTRAYDLLRMPLSQVGGPVATVALPALCRLISGDPERYREAYLRVLRSLLLVTIPVYVFLISYADLIVPLAFGEQWLRAIPMFQWLGLALLVKPIAYTTGWLFISQGRMQELLRWGVLAVLLAAASFVAGLPWGATGVAAAYTLVDVFIRAPILFWWVGRSGPVKSLDLLKAAAPIGVASILVALCLYAARWLIPAETAAWLVCLVGVFLTLFVSVGAMTVVPGGRRTFTDAIKLFRQRQA